MCRCDTLGFFPHSTPTGPHSLLPLCHFFSPVLKVRQKLNRAAGGSSFRRSDGPADRRMDLICRYRLGCLAMLKRIL